MIVDQQEDTRIVIAGSVETSDAQVAIVSIVGREQPRYAVEDLGKGSIAVFSDLFSRDDNDCRGRFMDFLVVFGSPVDRGGFLRTTFFR